MTAPATTTAHSNDLTPPLRIAMIGSAVVLGLLSLLALSRAAIGVALTAPGVREIAVTLHLMSVLPAIPLGIFVLLTRKGGGRHRILGRIWMALMGSTAITALFIRQINHGGFSWIHIFVPATLIMAWKAIESARAGRIAQHRRRLASMFLGAMVIPGLFAFAPGRVMAIWAFG